MAELSICRTCGLKKTGKFFNIFDEENEHASQIQKIRWELIHGWNSPIHPNDGLPQRICSACYNVFAIYFRFKNNCLIAQMKLKTLNGTAQEKKDVTKSMPDDNLILESATVDNDNVIIVDDLLNVESDNESNLTRCEIVSDIGIHNDEPEPQQIEIDDIDAFDADNSIIVVDDACELFDSVVQEEDYSFPTTSSQLQAHDTMETDTIIEFDESSITITKVQNDVGNTAKPIKKPFQRSEAVKAAAEAFQPNNAAEHVGNILKVMQAEKKYSRKRKMEFSNRLPPYRPQPRDLKCRFCYFTPNAKDVIYENKEALKEHITQSHDSKRPFNCHLCDKTYMDDKSLGVHIRFVHKHESTLCQYCGKTITRNMGRHINTFHKIGNYTCEICGTEFENISLKSFRYHKLWHNSNKLIKCQLCDSTFLQRYHLKQHMMTHKPEKQNCEDCGKEFKNRRNLKAHKQTKHGNLHPTKCLFCILTFTNLKDRLEHMKYFHNYAPKRKSKIVKCTHCDKYFISLKVMLNHVVVHSTEGRPFNCEVCEYNFKTQKELISHHLTHR